MIKLTDIIVSITFEDTKNDFKGEPNDVLDSINENIKIEIINQNNELHKLLIKVFFAIFLLYLFIILFIIIN